MRLAWRGTLPHTLIPAEGEFFLVVRAGADADRPSYTVGSSEGQDRRVYRGGVHVVAPAAEYTVQLGGATPNSVVELWLTKDCCTARTLALPAR